MCFIRPEPKFYFLGVLGASIFFGSLSPSVSITFSILSVFGSFGIRIANDSLLTSGAGKNVDLLTKVSIFGSISCPSVGGSLGYGI